MKILSIDPSTTSGYVGWATFDLDALTVKKLTPKNAMRWKKQVWKWGEWKLEGGSMEMRLFDLIQTIGLEIGEFQFLVGEKPAFYNNERGHIAAHQNYTIDIAAMLYWIAGWFHMDHRHFHPVTAMIWKGSVPKLITERQFFRVFGLRGELMPTKLTDHACDATMLLHWWLKTYGFNSRLVSQCIDAATLRLLL